jgi:hypothetical protein
MRPGTKNALIGAGGAVIVAIIGLIGTVLGYHQGKSRGIDDGKAQGVIEGKSLGFSEGKAEGEKGKKQAFDQIQTQVILDGTRWQVVYEDVSPPKKGSFEKAAIITFQQFGSRIVGEGQDTSGRSWIVEGATAERHVCYIYYEPGGQRLSFGTVFLELSNDGTKMTGQWAGWAPEGGKAQPRKVTLIKI